MLRNSIRSAVFAALLGSATAANAVVIDFDSVPEAGNGYAIVVAPYTEDGFQLTNDANNAPPPQFPYFHSPGDLTPTYVDSRTLYDPISSSTTTFNAVNSSLFNMVSIDLSELHQNTTNGPITFTGTLSGGGTVSQSFLLDGNYGLQTFFFVNFTNLAFVTWTQAPAGELKDYYQFDNIVVTATPLPGALPLFGSGLGAMGAFRWWRRRRRAAAA